MKKRVDKQEILSAWIEINPMTTTDLQTLGQWLAAHNLAAKSISDYSRKEISELVEFIIESFAATRPCPITWDHADRLIVPANADHGQLRAAIKMIETMIRTDVPAGVVAPVDASHVWDMAN